MMAYMLRCVVVAVVAATVVLLFTWAESTGKQARQAEQPGQPG